MFLIEGFMCEDGRVATGSESDPLSTVNKEMGTSVLKPQGIEFCQ